MQPVAKPVPCVDCPLQRCDGLRELSPEHLAYMATFKQGEVKGKRGSVVISQNDSSERLYTVLEGLLIRYRRLEDGRRQITNFMFPGDLVGLQAAFDEPTPHGVEVLIPARLCHFRRDAFPDLVGSYPDLGFDLTWMAAREEVILEEHLVAVGRRSASERVAYLAVWLVERGAAVGLSSSENTLDIPIRQGQIADMLGLSLVHTNRTVKSLAREDIVHWTPSSIHIPDLDRAARHAHFRLRPEREKPFI